MCMGCWCHYGDSLLVGICIWGSCICVSTHWERCDFKELGSVQVMQDNSDCRKWKSWAPHQMAKSSGSFWISYHNASILFFMFHFFSVEYPTGCLMLVMIPIDNSFFPCFLIFVNFLICWVFASITISNPWSDSISLVYESLCNFGQTDKTLKASQCTSCGLNVCSWQQHHHYALCLEPQFCQFQQWSPARPISSEHSNGKQSLMNMSVINLNQGCISLVQTEVIMSWENSTDEGRSSK